MKRRIIIAIVGVAVAFSLVSLVAPFEKNGAFWSAYLFGMVSICAQLYFFKSAFEGGSSARSRVYGFPIARIGAIYAVVQLVSSLAQMGLSEHLPLWVGFAANIVVLVLALIGCLGAETARDAVTRQDSTVSSSTGKMGDIRLAAESLAARNRNADFDAALNALADRARFSDPKSSESTADIEDKISRTLTELEKSLGVDDASRAHELIEGAMDDIDERNRICKASKQPC